MIGSLVSFIPHLVWISFPWVTDRIRSLPLLLIAELPHLHRHAFVREVFVSSSSFRRNIRRLDSFLRTRPMKAWRQCLPTRRATSFSRVESLSSNRSSSGQPTTVLPCFGLDAKRWDSVQSSEIVQTAKQWLPCGDQREGRRYPCFYSLCNDNSNCI